MIAGAGVDMAEARLRYERDGVVPLPGLLRGDRLDAIQQAVAAARSRPSEEGRPSGRTSVRHLPGRIVIRGLAHASAGVAGLVGDPDIAALVAGISGADGPMTCWNDLTLIYAPSAPAGESTWHHDIPAFPMRAAQLPSLWIALTPVDEDRSPLVFLPGSQKREETYPPSTAGDAAELPPGYAPMPDWDAMVAQGTARRVWWPMQPGDAILLDARVVHCTPANRAEHEERISLITRWFAPGTVWHRDRYSTPIPGLVEDEWRPGEPVRALQFA